MADPVITPQPTGGVAGQAGPAAVPQPTGAKVEFSAEQEAEVNRRAAEARRDEREASERKAAKVQAELQAKLDKLAAERMTEDEKKLAAAVEAGKAEVLKEMSEKLQAKDIELAIRDAGANPKLKASILDALRESDGSIGDIGTLKDRIAALYAEHPYFQACGAAGNAPVPQSGSPAGRALTATIKRSELLDHRVFLANEAKIKSGEVRVVEG